MWKKIVKSAKGILFSLSTSDNSDEEFQDEDFDKATFAGGCFWCMQPPFENIEGVERVITGYAGGETEDPTYSEVSTGNTGHYEAIQVTYNPEEVSYEELLEVYWMNIDPTDEGGQFADRGSQYRTAIFYHEEDQKSQAEKSKKDLEESEKFDDPIVTKILPYSEFYKAEEKHQ